MAEKTGFILYYDMLDNLKLLGNDVAIEVLSALSQFDQGENVGKLSPQAQFAYHAYIPTLKKSKRRWEASVNNGSQHKANHELNEANNNLIKPSDNLDEANPELGQCVTDIDTDIVNVNEFTAATTAENALIPVSSNNLRKLDMTPEQLVLFNAAKACFESSERTKAMVFKDKNTSAMQMRKLKEIVVACTNIEPNFPADFLRTILESFRTIINGRLRGKAEFTPRSLSTPWIWETVIGSLSDNNDVSPELLESIGRMFK